MTPMPTIACGLHVIHRDARAAQPPSDLHRIGRVRRIAVIAPPWIAVPPVSYGGTETVIDTLCRGLAASGHEVLLIASGDSTCPVARRSLHPVGLGTEAISSAAEMAHAAFGYEAAHAWGADIVHDHTLTGPALGVARADLPVVTTNHGPFAGDLAAVYRTMSWKVPVIAISRAQAATAVACRVSAVIHHGVDLEAYPEPRPGGAYALFLGRMSPDKGVHLAIEVARLAGTPLVIAAKMRERAEHAYFEARVRPLLGRDVTYIGEVDRHGLGDLLAGASCLLNPIQWDEPFGMVAIEALAAGVPVVATPRGAMPEIVDDGRTGFIRESVPELAEAVRQAADLDRGACRHSAATWFSMEVMAANHVRFYLAVRNTFDARLAGRS